LGNPTFIVVLSPAIRTSLWHCAELSTRTLGTSDSFVALVGLLDS
ncbi:hypothetical protein NPIL_551631, partial [Nephila pilipes]